jgi:predicted RNA-binding protein YlqC (UPF0109 family)
MKELLEHIVKAIVNNPEAVSIEEKESVDFPGLTILTINVAEEDKGVVIGRRGRTINSIRDLITINAIRNDKRVKVLIKDDDRGHHVQSSDENTDGMLVDEEI